MAQHDYIIANQSGAAFRSDLNGALEAIATNNSGTLPTTTYPYQWWADTAGLLKIRNGGNNAWITVGTLADANLGLLSLAGGTLTGALLADDAGTAGAAAIGFDGDVDTGLFRKGANQLGFTAGGAERAFVDASGVTIQAQGDLRLADADSSNWVALHAPTTVASNLTFTVPATYGSADQALVGDGTGGLTFANRSRLVTSTLVSASSTSVDLITTIPSWAKRVTVMFDGVSTTSTGVPMLRLGTASGVESTGYSSGVTNLSTSSLTTQLSVTSGFELVATGAATNVLSGQYVFSNITGNVWVVTGQVHNGATSQQVISGRKTLAAALTRVQLTTTGGTDTFDAGSVNVMYED